MKSSNLLKALIGLILVFVYHIPHLIYLFLHVSYAYVFNNPHNLTADPTEHLKRAKRLLRRGWNSELLYAALEIRFALERMVDHELILSEQVPQRMADESSHTKKLNNIHRIDPQSEYAHDVYLVNRETGSQIKWGRYKPLEKVRINELNGRLGDLLHPKRGLLLGIKNDPWYTGARKFLQELVQYLQECYKDNTPFFTFSGISNIQMVRSDIECNKNEQRNEIIK